jgi:hypothetical protein
MLLQTSPRTRRTQSQTGRITTIITMVWGMLVVGEEVALEVVSDSLNVPGAHELNN